MAKSHEESVAFWKKHYIYVKSQVDRIDAGEKIPADSIAGMIVGQRQHCVDEANYAVKKLEALNSFDLPKIK